MCNLCWIIIIKDIKSVISLLIYVFQTLHKSRITLTLVLSQLREQEQIINPPLHIKHQGILTKMSCTIKLKEGMPWTRALSELKASGVDILPDNFIEPLR